MMLSPLTRFNLSFFPIAKSFGLGAKYTDSKSNDFDRTIFFATDIVL